VIFDIDANGILNVLAKDKATDKAQSMQIIPSSGLSDSEIEEMVRQAELHRDEDARNRELIETQNKADTLIFASEKALSEAGDKISPEIQAEVKSRIEALKTAKVSDEVETIRASIDELSLTLQKIGQAMYSQTDQTTEANLPPDDDFENDYSKN